MNLDRRTVFRAFFFGAFLLLLYQILKLLSPFFTPLVAAVTLALIFYPVHAALRRRVPWENAAAGLSVALILLMIIAPFSLLAWLMIQQAGSLAPFVGEKIHAWRSAPSLDTLLPPSLARLAERLQGFLSSWQIDFQDMLMKTVAQLGETLSSLGGKIVKNVAFIIFDIFVTGFSLFFLFRDGTKISKWIVDIIPMETAHKEHIVARLGQTLSAVVRGVFLTAATQGLLAGLGYMACGVRFSVILGFATAFTAPIPFVGAPAVWLPVSLYLLLTGSQTEGFLLMAWGALVVGTIDNILRPILIGEKAKLPIFLLFFGMLGGIQVYGPVGLLTGPLLIACAMSFAKIYREQILVVPRPPQPPPPKTPAAPIP